MQLIDNYQPLCQSFLNSYKLKYMSTYLLLYKAESRQMAGFQE
jgi:hypothetical protein